MSVPIIHNICQGGPKKDSFGGLSLSAIFLSIHKIHNLKFGQFDEV